MDSANLNYTQKNTLFLLHDIRLPLSSISGMTSLARKEIDDKERVAHCLTRIEIATNYLLNLLNDMMDFTKLSEGKFKVNLSEFNLYQIVRSIQYMIEPLTSQKNQNFNIMINPSLNLLLTGDSIRLEQILMNLLTNAVKYTGVGGSVSLEIDEIERKEDYIVLRFRIQDNGIGMSESFLENAYKPFYRENEAFSNGRSSSGLGLYLTKILVDMMDGTIVIKSDQSVGTDITVDIPFYLPKDNASSELTDENPNCLEKYDFRNHKVLLAEDNEDITEIMVDMLEHAGLSIDCAKDGKEAILLFENSLPGEYSGILMDVMMPVMDGLRTAKYIRNSNHRDSKSIPIIAITADSIENNIDALSEAGIDAHLPKPIDYQELFDLLEGFFKH